MIIHNFTVLYPAEDKIPVSVKSFLDLRRSYSMNLENMPPPPVESGTVSIEVNNQNLSVSHSTVT